MATARSVATPRPGGENRGGATLSWVGPGVTAFALAAESQGTGSKGRGAPRRCPNLAAFEGWAGGEVGTELEESVGEEALGDYFDSGGRGCVVLQDSRLMQSGWLGEEARAGSSSGIYALADVDDVGLIVVLGAGASGTEGGVVELAKRRPDLFFLLEGAEDASDQPRFLRSNVAVLRPSGTTLGGLAAYLESVDFTEDPPFSSLRIAPPGSLRAADCLRMEAWRLQAGLRRSLDLGTRWMVFEVNYSLLWRRVEREITGFFHRLRRRGFFKELEHGRRLEATCEPSATSHVTIRVAARQNEI